MRLSGPDGAPGPGPGGAEGSSPAGFGAALREAEVRQAASGRAGRRDRELTSRRGREAAMRQGREASTRRERQLGQVQARRASPGAPHSVASRRDGAGPWGAAGAGDAGPAGAQPIAGALPSERSQPGAPPAGAVALSLAARAVVPAAEAFRRSGREALTLDFGPALGVELRAHAGGVDLTLAAGPGLSAAARAELPALVRALAARGVTVVRAGVRPRGAAEGHRR